MLQPFLKAGVIFYHDNDHALGASFVGPANGVDTFLVRTETDDVFADIESGFTLEDTDNGSRLLPSYEERYSNNTR